MKFYKVREEILNGKNIIDLPLRVTFYARVSTDSDEQLNSLDNQITFFENFINSNNNWTYVKGYIDEGISGSSVKKRKKFLQMIDDAKNNMFDLIVTKEISRFSRNLSDSIKYTQELMINDVGVYFQSNGINTYDTNSEFILNMMGSLAQEEVKRLSSRVKWGHKEAIKKGRVLGSNSITGYKKNDAKLVIDESEAKKIKRIFELYASSKYGFYKLAIKLHQEGINNSKDNIYDKDTLKRIIQNPKYKGFYRGHTTEVIDYKTKKRIYVPIEEQIIYKDEEIPAIVSEELWDKANQILDSRSKLMKESNGNARKAQRKYSYTSKIYCDEHKTCYQRMLHKDKIKWACSNYVKHRINVCESPIILEEDLNNIFAIIIKRILPNENEVLKDMIKYYSNLKKNNNYQYEINKSINEIKSINDKKDRILELSICGSIDNDEFKERNDKFNEEIKTLKSRINELENERDIFLDKFNNSDLEIEIMDKINYKNNVCEFVNEFLDKITVYKKNNDRHNLVLKIYLNLFKKKKIAYEEAKLLFNEHTESLYLGRRNYLKNNFDFFVYFV